MDDYVDSEILHMLIYYTAVYLRNSQASCCMCHKGLDDDMCR